MSVCCVQLFASLCILSLLCTRNVASKGETENDMEPPYTPFGFVHESNEFALKLYKELAQDQSRSNIFFSPISLSVAMAMVYVGVDGNTKSQMTSGMNWKNYEYEEGPFLKDIQNLIKFSLNNNNNNNTLMMANRLFADNSFKIKGQYLKKTAKYFLSELQSMDFQEKPDEMRKKINKWVSKMTAKKIKNLMPKGSITEDTVLVLANAIYFKGSWLYPFKKSATKKQKFRSSFGPNKTNEYDVEMMSESSSKQYVYYNSSELGAEVLQLPYAYNGNPISMFIMLPHDEKDISQIEEELDMKIIGKIFDKQGGPEVELSLPKFTLKENYKMKEHLEALGMEDLFRPGVADLSGIDGSKRLFVSDVFHKAFISVDEKGTTATAATGVEIGTRSHKITVRFNVDRPFVFLIVERSSWSILFLGRLGQPNQPASNQ